jgi:hypothetical protein
MNPDHAYVLKLRAGLVIVVTHRSEAIKMRLQPASAVWHTPKDFHTRVCVPALPARDIPVREIGRAHDSRFDRFLYFEPVSEIVN